MAVAIDKREYLALEVMREINKSGATDEKDLRAKAIAVLEAALVPG